MDDITPASVMTGFWRWFGVGVFALIVIAAIVLGGWQAGWWFASHNVNRQTQIIQNSDSNQRSLVSDLTQKIGDVQTITVQMDAASGQQLADLHAQRIAEGNLACADAAQLSVPLHGGEGGWVRANCQAGNVSPGSSLRK